MKFVTDTYHIANEDEWSEINYNGDDPRLAVEVWAEVESKNRTMCSINVMTKADACELIDYIYKHMDWFVGVVYERFGHNREYLQYLEDAICKAYDTRCESFHECPYGDDRYYRDQVHPFDIG